MIPQSLDSQATGSAPRAVRAELTSPKLSEKTDPKTMVIATMLVTFGMK